VPGRADPAAAVAIACGVAVTSLFIAVEGPNGVGKTTVAALLAARLHARTGTRVHLTGEPTSSPLGQLLRDSESVLHGRPLALALAADRAAHVEDEIIPTLDGGAHVVTDRYVPSSLVLQHLDGLDLREIWSYNRYVLSAIVFYLTDDPVVITERLTRRPWLTRLEASGTPAQELQLYRKAFTFLKRDQWRQYWVDCRRKDPDRVVADILDHLENDPEGCRVLAVDPQHPGHRPAPGTAAVGLAEPPRRGHDRADGNQQRPRQPVPGRARRAGRQHGDPPAAAG
jgi:dTMP kinase